MITKESFLIIIIVLALTSCSSSEKGNKEENTNHRAEILNLEADNTELTYENKNTVNQVENDIVGQSLHDLIRAVYTSVEIFS